MKITHCPHCDNELSFSQANLAKIEDALSRLQSGTLKLGCPSCKKSIELMPDGSLADWKNLGVKEAGGPVPPQPPDLSWLTSGMFDEEEEIRDIPKALVFMEDIPERENIAGALVETFYQPVIVNSDDEAFEQMRFAEFGLVVQQSNFKGNRLSESLFHQHMRLLPMVKRRYVYYVLVGPNYRTLYGLEALANSANLVVNFKEIDHFKLILKKGKAESEELFGPLIDALKDQGVR